jgi:phage terminase large subunit-like protein
MELIADKDKVTRSGTVALYMENGKVYFLAGAAWLTDFESELLLFPNGVHDDQVDVTSYAGLVLAQNAISTAAEPVSVDLGEENRRMFADFEERVFQ